MIMLQVQFRCMTARENGSEQQSEQVKDVFCHPPSSTLEDLVESLGKIYTRYKMEISAEKTKLMTNSANGIQREIKIKGQKQAGYCNKLQVPWSSCFR